MAAPRRKRHDGVRTLADIKARCVIDADTGCWHWRSAMSRSLTRKVSPSPRVWLPDGLGDGRPAIATAAKAAWMLAGRELPGGHVVWRSVCARSDCVNPEHGAAGTRQAMHRAIADSGRLRGNPARAAINARNRMAMVTPLAVVRQAEAMIDAGRLLKDVRAELGLSESTVTLIRRGLHPHSAGRNNLVRGASVFTIAVEARA